MLTEASHGESSDQTPEFFAFITEFIQLYALKDKPTQMLLLSHKHEPAMIWLHQGKVLNAKYMGQEGREAFFEILRWPRGHIQKVVETQATEQKIEGSLSQLLLDAYWEIMERGVLIEEEASFATLDGSKTLEEIARLEQERIEAEKERLHKLDKSKLQWGETLREGIQSIDGLVSYNVLTTDGSEALRRTITEAHEPYAELAQAIIGAINDTANTPGFSLMLTIKDCHHVLIGFEQTKIVLHGVFDRHKIQLAMAHWKLSQLLPKG